MSICRWSWWNVLERTCSNILNISCHYPWIPTQYVGDNNHLKMKLYHICRCKVAQIASEGATGKTLGIDFVICIYAFNDIYINYSDIFRRFVIYSPRLVCILPCLENESNPGIFGWCLSNPKITPPFRCCFLFLKVATGFSCIIRLTWLLLSAVFIGWWLTSRDVSMFH